MNRYTKFNIKNIDNCNFENKSNEFITFNLLTNGFKMFQKSADGDFLNLINKEMGNKSEELLEDFFCNMNEIVLLSKRFSDINEYFLIIMIFFIEINYKSLKKGGKSYCSHSQGFFTFFKNKEDIENKFEIIFEQREDVFIKIYNLCKSKSKYQKIYQFIENSVSLLKKDSNDYIKNGDIKFVRYKKNNLLYKSQFHSSLLNDKETFIFFNSDKFKIERFTTICFYEFMKFCFGINYLHRSLLDYIIYRTIEEEEKISYIKR